MTITHNSQGDATGSETGLQRLARLLLSPAMLRYKFWLKWHRLDYSGESVESLGLDRATAHQHGMSGGPNLEHVLNELKIPADANCIDYGSGKGISTITLARYFEFVLGIELSQKLVEISMNNVWQFKGLRDRISFACVDAGDYQGIWAYTYAYCFNSFPASVMAKVAANIRESVHRHPRKLTFIYKNPACSRELDAAGFYLERVFEFKNDHPVRVFSIQP